MSSERINNPIIKIPDNIVYALIIFDLGKSGKRRLLKDAQIWIPNNCKCSYQRTNESKNIIDNEASDNRAYTGGMTIKLDEKDLRKSGDLRLQVFADKNQLTGIASAMLVPFSVKDEGWIIRVTLKCYISDPKRAFEAFEKSSGYGITTDVELQGEKVGTLQYWAKEASVDEKALRMRGYPAQIQNHLKSNMDGYLKEIIANESKSGTGNPEESVQKEFSALFEIVNKIQKDQSRKPKTDPLSCSDSTYSEKDIDEQVNVYYDYKQGEKPGDYRKGLCTTLTDLWLNKAIKTELGPIEVTELKG